MKKLLTIMCLILALCTAFSMALAEDTTEEEKTPEYTEAEVIVEPTASKTGWLYLKNADDEPPVGFTLPGYKAATCKEDGVNVNYCALCHKVLVGKVKVGDGKNDPVEQEFKNPPMNQRRMTQNRTPRMRLKSRPNTRIARLRF